MSSILLHSIKQIEQYLSLLNTSQFRKLTKFISRNYGLIRMLYPSRIGYLWSRLKYETGRKVPVASSDTAEIILQRLSIYTVRFLAPVLAYYRTCNIKEEYLLTAHIFSAPYSVEVIARLLEFATKLQVYCCTLRYPLTEDKIANAFTDGGVRYHLYSQRHNIFAKILESSGIVIILPTLYKKYVTHRKTTKQIFYVLYNSTKLRRVVHALDLVGDFYGYVAGLLEGVRRVYLSKAKELIKRATS